MQHPVLFIMRSPGGDNEAGSADDSAKPADQEGEAGKEKEEKGFFGKIKEALQDWSNADKKEQEEDDATP